MKKIVLAIASLFVLPSLFAQSFCGSQRYDTVMFSTVATISNVVYGWNTSYTGQVDTLKMDIYQFSGDTVANRPLIIFAHGGSFTSGDKANSYCVDFCTRFARRGYVTASVNYRLGVEFPYTQASVQKTVWRAVQDMKAAVRFFKKDALGSNTYKINPDMVFIGGASAGAIIAVHYAYLDQPSEIPTVIDTVAVGGLEGNSGNPGYSSAVKAIINYAGAITDTSWMHPGDEPMVSVQGNADNTVPYCTASMYGIMPLSGCGSMNIRCNHTGIENPTHTYYGQGHISPLDTAKTADHCNMDSTALLTSNFLYKQLGCTPSGTVTYTNAPTCQIATGVDKMVLDTEKFSLWPNPAKNQLTIDVRTIGKSLYFEILDVFGQVVYKSTLTNNKTVIDIEHFSVGVYLIKIGSGTSYEISKFIKE